MKLSSSYCWDCWEAKLAQESSIRSYGGTLLPGALAGLFASIALIFTEIQQANNPDAPLACDLNSVLSCGKSLVSWQAHLFFSIPNSVIGALCFSFFTVLCIFLLAKKNLSLWVWRGLLAGLSFALVWVFWFLYQSATAFDTLCPYCLLAWVASVYSWVLVFAYSSKSGALNFLPSTLTAFVYRERWILTILALVFLSLITLIAMFSRFQSVL